MKIDRLLETTIILLNKGSTTAKELAERFSVSTRTIYRDIDILSSAGVPVYANRGSGGGIALLDNFLLPKTIVTKEESDSILFSLKTLQATKYPEIDRILEKLGALFQTASTDWIQIDFSPWGSNPNQYDRLTNIKNAILRCKIVEFEYISSANQKSIRQLEPMRLIFKGQAWYLWGYCALRDDYRMFRISRIKSLRVLDIGFDKNETRERRMNQTASENTRDEKTVSIELKFDEKALHRLYDDYDDDMIIKNGNGTFTLKIDFPESDWVYGYIMSFGEYVEVVEPPHIRELIREKNRKVLNIYEGKDVCHD